MEFRLVQVYVVGDAHVELVRMLEAAARRALQDLL